MGNHRAERRGPRRAPSDARPSTQYAGKRVGGRAPISVTVSPDLSRVALPAQAELEAPTVETPAVLVAAHRTPASFVTTDTTDTHYFDDLDATAELPLVRKAPTPGRRKAVKHAGSRGPLYRGLPSPPLLIGITVLAVSIGGALTATGPDLTTQGATTLRPASALNGAVGVGRVDTLRGKSISRDSARDTLQQANGSELVKAAEADAVQRDAALGQLAAKVQRTADEIAQNLWIAPLDPVVLTAQFGDYGLWASYHTGLDFNGETGDPIKAVADGVVTSAGYDGSYGNKTVVTLSDGTEIWYCHQTSQSVSDGDTVTQGEIIGTVGATGNVTGSHLHIEVRPGGGDPVDPYPAFVMHGVPLPS